MILPGRTEEKRQTSLRIAVGQCSSSVHSVTKYLTTVYFNIQFSSQISLPFFSKAAQTGCMAHASYCFNCTGNFSPGKMWQGTEICHSRRLKPEFSREWNCRCDCGIM